MRAKYDQKTGERVRIRFGNLSIWNHPVHLHGAEFDATSIDGDPGWHSPPEHSQAKKVSQPPQDIPI